MEHLPYIITFQKNLKEGIAYQKGQKSNLANMKQRDLPITNVVLNQGWHTQKNG